MDSEKARLTYSDSRGLAEKIRILLCLAEIPYENRSLKTRSQYLEMKDDCLFGQTPLLEYKGMKLVQSDAIARYVAAKAKLHGTNDEERARIDMLYDATRDWVPHLMACGFSCSEEESLKKGRTAKNKYAPIYDKELKNNKTGYLVGSSMTLADVGLFETVLDVEEHFGKESLDEFLNIQSFMERMRSDKRIQNYLENHRFDRLTPEKTKEIKAVYNFTF